MSRSPQVPPRFLTTTDGQSIAWLNDGVDDGDTDRCGTFWLGGFKSDMRGSKAEVLAEHARQHNRSFVRFDYSGHGESSGDFVDGTISSWLEQAHAIFDGCAPG